MNYLAIIVMVVIVVYFFLKRSGRQTSVQQKQEDTTSIASDDKGVIMDNNSKLTKILAEFDARDDCYADFDVYSSLKAILPKDEEYPRETPLDYELTAFAFTEDYESRNPGWGTYYGPMWAWSDESGNSFENPSISKISHSAIKYWETRRDSANHPILKHRYADLVWDLSKPAIDEHPDIENARILIDSAIGLCHLRGFKRPTSVKTKLGRALSIALSISDVDRAEKVKQCIVQFEDLVAQDSMPGLWGFSFDLLIANKKIVLKENEEEKIVKDLEDRLLRLSNPGNESFDPHSVEMIVMRLSKYYQQHDQKKEVERILRIYKQAFEIAAERTSPLVAISYLQKVYEFLAQSSFHNLTEGLEEKLREFGERSRAHMKTFSTSFEIEQEQLDEYLEDLSAEGFEKALLKIAFNYIPKRDEVEEQVKELANKAPLQALIKKSVTDIDGRTVAEVGSIMDDLEGHIVLQISQNMHFESLFLRESIDHLRANLGLDVKKLVDYLYFSPAFPPEFQLLVESGLNAYFREDFIGCCSILVPQFENILRKVLVGSQGTIYRTNRNGGLEIRQMGDILRDPILIEVFGDDIITYLKVLLTDARAWNLRNSLCHGLLRPDSFGREVADRVIHVLLIFAVIRPQEKGA